MKTEIDLNQDEPTVKLLTPNAQRAEDAAEQRRKLKEYGDLPPEEIAEKEAEAKKTAEEKHATDNPPAPADLGKFKPDKFETLEEQLSYVDGETSRNL